MKNVPQVNLGIVAVSRDCFPITLSASRRGKVVEEITKLNLPITEIKTTVENEKDAMLALKELKDVGCNACVIYLGNFGPEGPETMLDKNLTAPQCLLPLQKKQPPP